MAIKASGHRCARLINSLPYLLMTVVHYSIETSGSDDLLGRPCYFNMTASSLYSVRVHLNNRLLVSEQYVAHGSELVFHCPIQRFYRLTGPNTVRCKDGNFEEKLPICEAVLISNRLTALVDTEYIMGPGGVYVVFSGSQVRLSCYHALSRSYRPTWQWVGRVDNVFIEEKTSFGQVTVVAKFEARNDTEATFTCSDPTEDLHVKIVARPLHCPLLKRSSGLTISQTSWLRADFSCPTGTILLGAESASCMPFRQWDAAPPICAFYGCSKRKLKSDGTQDDGLLFPCQLPELSGDLVAYSRSSRVQSMDVVPHGTDVEFNCLNLGRAVKIGASESRCLNGNWTAAPPVCAVPDRSSLQGIVFDFDFRYRFGPSGILYVDPKTEVIIKCISPPKLMPRFNYTIFDELSPVFVIKAEAEDSSAVARVFIFNTGAKFDAEFHCTTNETNAVFESRTVRIITREARCGTFETREGLLYKVDGNIAVFRCQQPAKLLGQSILRCVNGDWDHAQPMCVFQERCAAWLEDASNATGDPGGFRSNDNVTYVVREKQVLQENGTYYQANQQLDSTGSKPATPPHPFGVAVEEDEDESAEVTDEELNKIVEEADSEDNDGAEASDETDGDDADSNDSNDDDKDDDDDDAVRPKRPLLPTEAAVDLSKEPIVCAQPSGLFSYPSDCRHFVHCTEGVAKVLRCPQKLIFSPSVKMCREKDDEIGCYADD